MEPPLPEDEGVTVSESAEMAQGSSKRRLVVGGAVVVAIVASVAVVVAIVLSGADGSGTYDQQTRAAFLVACTADGGPSVAGTCQCLYDGILAEIPFDRYNEVNDALLAQIESNPAKEVVLPDDFQPILRRCVSRVG